MKRRYIFSIIIVISFGNLGAKKVPELSTNNQIINTNNDDNLDMIMLEKDLIILEHKLSKLTKNHD